MKKSIILLSLLICSTVLPAQPKTQLFGVNYEYFGNSSLENAPSIGNLNELKVGYGTLNVFGFVPIVRTENYKIVSKIDFDQTSFYYNSAIDSGSEIRPDQLYTIKLKIIYSQNINEKWTAVFLINPALSSDFNNGLSGDDLLFNGGIIMSRSISERFKLGFGIVSSYAFGEKKILPVIDLRYASKNEKFFVSARFPKVTATYLAAEKLEISIKAVQEGSQYNYKNIEGPVRSTDYVKFSSMNFSTGTSYEIFKNICIITELGMSISRQLKIYDENNAKVGDLTPEQSLFVRFGLSYGINRE